MTGKFQNKYRISSTRLQKWDYGSNASYFITICTKNREHYFGDISNGEMRLSEMGIIAETEWLKSFEMRPDMNLQMGEYVIMPNHFHAIIIIGDNDYNMDGRDPMHCVSTNVTTAQNQFGSQSKNLASIIRGYKIGVTTNVRKIHADFAWQSRFHDHIIRNNESFNRIEQYIKNNPSTWTKDNFNKYYQRNLGE